MENKSGKIQNNVLCICVVVVDGQLGSFSSMELARFATLDGLFYCAGLELRSSTSSSTSLTINNGHYLIREVPMWSLGMLIKDNLMHGGSIVLLWLLSNSKVELIGLLERAPTIVNILS
jgi:hypothetical protein